jgi:hypothetical protein
VPSCPAAWLAGCGVVRGLLAGARHKNPCGRWVGQWCHGIGGWQGQHHVMDERMAPQLWHGSVAHLVGVVNLRVAWLVWALHRGHISGYVCGGDGVVLFCGVVVMSWMMRSGFVRLAFRGVHCGAPFRLRAPCSSNQAPPT